MDDPTQAIITAFTRAIVVRDDEIMGAFSKVVEAVIQLRGEVRKLRDIHHAIEDVTRIAAAMEKIHLRNIPQPPVRRYQCAACKGFFDSDKDAEFCSPGCEAAGESKGTA